jgi:predicted hydrocarbon binding protein
MQFEFDAENGAIKDKVTGERCVIITQARIQEIFSRLSDIFQSGAKVIFFEAGKAAGERFVEDRPEIMKAEKKVFLETAIQRYTDAGLGKIEIVSFDPANAEVNFRIQKNFFAELCGDGTPYCNCVEGFVSGIYKQVMHKTLTLQKTKCAAKGDACCEWQMTLK